jgi:hypothetical protein
MGHQHGEVSCHVQLLKTLCLVGRFRLFGWAFLIVGTLLSVAFFIAAFDPSAKITINHVPRYDLRSKILAAAFTPIFPAIGALLALTPKKKFEAFLRPLAMQAAGLGESVLGKK